MMMDVDVIQKYFLFTTNQSYARTAITRCLFTFNCSIVLNPIEQNELTF